MALSESSDVGKRVVERRQGPATCQFIKLVGSRPTTATVAFYHKEEDVKGSEIVGPVSLLRSVAPCTSPTEQARKGVS